MGIWEQARSTWAFGRATVEQLSGAKATADAAAGAASAAADARQRAMNLPLVLTGPQAYGAMFVRYDRGYWVRSASAMTAHDIKDAQWQLVESWTTYRRLSLITNAIQWALSKMIGGSVPVPDHKDILNSLHALFNAWGDNPTRAEVMEFWAKYHSSQLSAAEQVAKGLTETGIKGRGGSLVVPSRRQALEEAMRDE